MTGELHLGGVMGRLVGTALLLVVLSVPVRAEAQKAQARLGIGASAVFPTGEFHSGPNGEGFKAGWQGMAMLDVGVPYRPTGFRLEGVYGENQGNDQLIQSFAFLGPGLAVKMRMYGGDADVMLKNLPKAAGKPTTYLLGGIGVRRLSRIATQGGLSSDTSGTKFSWNAGGGVYLGGKASMIFLEARYVHVASFADFSTNHFPVTAGVRFGLSR